LIAVATISPARKAAFDILLAVEGGKAHSDELLRGKAVDMLSPADRNLATALVLGVLRWQIWLDRQMLPLLKRPNAKLDREVLIALRLSAFQLLFLDRVPAHAAIDESVELAKRSGHRFAAGMVNAVLRKLSVRAPHPEFSEESPTEMALTQAHPAWMVERWVGFYGSDAAQAICCHGQRQPRRSVRIADPEAEAEIAKAGIQLEPAGLLTAARTVISGDVTATAAFEEGRVRVQDEGSQLIGELAAAIGQDLDQKAKSILDTCAAPGGKTLILAERSPQASIVACEANPRRLAELRSRLAGLARVECRLADASALGEDGKFDLALADVPCSGTGTLGRNPEIRHRLRQEEFAQKAKRQRAILRSAIGTVRLGGRVVYSTCSLEPEENEQVVAIVLAENLGARQISIASQLDGLRRKGILTQAGAERLQGSLTADGALRLLPGDATTDGFFVAVIEKIE
jgi:16S rRNA (cytosine967-C5)-methyltransferase